ncbi:MAG: B12-binding domain-containing radical SAM protein, partial [Candidatus Bathyarchaeia archaeon]
MKVLLVQPSYRRARESRGGTWGCHPPLGLCYIAAVLEQNDVPVEILDANALDLTQRDVVAHIRRENPQIIGFSMLTPAHNFCVGVAREIQDEYLVVAGGPHAVGLSEELLGGGFDVVVRGEGEYTMLDLAEMKPLRTISGISYRKPDGTIAHNEDRPLVRDLDAIPFPARHLLPSNGVNLPYRAAASRYFPWSTILTSRGCPYACYFCNKNISGQLFRVRSPGNVIEEIEFLANEYGVREIDIADDTFNIDLDR